MSLEICGVNPCSCRSLTVLGGALLVAVALVTLYPGAAAAPQELRLGVVGALSGPASAYGDSVRRGAELAAARINEAGGVRGVKVALLTYDDQQDETVTSAKVTQAIYQDRVHALIGTTDSGATHVAARIAMKAKVPLLVTVATDPTLTRLNNPWVFRNLADDRIQGRTLVEHLARDRGLRSLVVLHVDTRYGRGGAAVVETAARLNSVPVLARIPFARNQNDFGALVSQVRDRAPQAVVVWSLFAEGAALVAALRAGGVTAPLFAPDGLALPAFVERAGRAAEGLTVTWPFVARLEDPLVADFVKRYQAAYATAPDSFAAHAYDAVHLLADAVRYGSPVPDRQDLRRELSRVRDFHGVAGAFAFDETGNSTLPVALATVQNGAFVPLPPRR